MGDFHGGITLQCVGEVFDVGGEFVVHVGVAHGKVDVGGDEVGFVADVVALAFELESVGRTALQKGANGIGELDLVIFAALCFGDEAKDFGGEDVAGRDGEVGGGFLGGGFLDEVGEFHDAILWYGSFGDAIAADVVLGDFLECDDGGIVHVVDIGELAGDGDIGC